MKSVSPTLIFGLKFAFFFALLMGLFEASRGSFAEKFLVEDCILKPATSLIRVLNPNEPVQLTGRIIESSKSKLRVTRGCEGVEIFLMLAAGILAYPASASARLRGIALGSVLAYALSLARLVALHFTLRYAPTAWESLHGLVLPLAPLIAISLYFLTWSAKAPPRVSAHAA